MWALDTWTMLTGRSFERRNVFERIVEVTPSLYFLQLTADPVDDLSPEIEERYRRAREALASVLLDTTDPPAPRPDAL